MSFDFDTLEALRRQHPAWRLLQADSAALLASFLHRAFVQPNRCVIHQAELASVLDDTLYAVREQRGPATLLAHQVLWTAEPQPTQRDLPRLSDAERRLYDDLRWCRLRDEPLRLEQERVGFGHLERALAAVLR